MRLEDVDFELEYDTHKFKLSEFTDNDIDQIKKITEAIMLEKIFDCDVKATICAFQLFIESIIATDDWISKGNHHH